ncbi:uncharacterized protein LOC122562424 [Chiloscyllium plagiosum]|uniref:uncharacterized protein LOC122562424 n=1 Tax=Chiloscyllium plagiosum TaxID=36176 RepID=UPI001CB7B050|nr:uncharacterized protein LOC122562424 [Chiloscyllium plagiosum]
MSIGRAVPAARSAHVPLGYAAVRASCHRSALRTGTGRQQPAIPLKCRERLADPPGLVTGSTTTSRQHGNGSEQQRPADEQTLAPRPARPTESRGCSEPRPWDSGTAGRRWGAANHDRQGGAEQYHADECYDKGKALLWQKPIHQLINISLEVLQMNVMVEGSHSSGKSTFIMFFRLEACDQWSATRLRNETVFGNSDGFETRIALNELKRKCPHKPSGNNMMTGKKMQQTGNTCLIKFRRLILLFYFIFSFK